MTLCPSPSTSRMTVPTVTEALLVELYFEGGVGVGHEEALRGGDGELGEPEEVVEVDA